MQNPQPNPQPRDASTPTSRTPRRLRRTALGALIAATAVAGVASTAAADPTPSAAPTSSTAPGTDGTTPGTDGTAPGTDGTTPPAPGGPAGPGGPGAPGGPAAGPAADDTLHAHGTITSLDGDTLVLTGPRGETRTVTLTDDTTVVLDRGPGAGEESADRSVLAVGLRVHADLGDVAGDEGTDAGTAGGTALRVVVEPLRADGEVTAVDGTLVTLAGPDGRTAVVDVAGAEVLLDGAAADASAITVGEHVHAQAAAGTAAADDGSFTATRVEVGHPAPPAGAPVPPADAPAPPAGSPAAPSTDGATPAAPSATS